MCVLLSCGKDPQTDGQTAVHSFKPIECLGLMNKEYLQPRENQHFTLYTSI